MEKWKAAKKEKITPDDVLTEKCYDTERVTFGLWHAMRHIS